MSVGVQATGGACPLPYLSPLAPAWSHVGSAGHTLGKEDEEIKMLKSTVPVSWQRLCPVGEWGVAHAAPWT